MPRSSHNAICVLLLALSSSLLPLELRADWHVNVSTPPPPVAQVGDVVSIGYTVSVDAGADSLSIASVESGAGTSGLGDISFPLSPQTVAPGTTTAEAFAIAAVVAAPGVSGVHLQLSASGFLGADAGTRTASTNAIVVVEAVTATLSGSLARVSLSDQITYDLVLTNTSDTDAQIGVLGFDVPSGSALVARINGASSLSGNDATGFQLVVSVNDGDADGATIVQTPSGVTYAMSSIGLSSRAITVSPSSFTSTVQVPLFRNGFE